MLGGMNSFEMLLVVGLIWSYGCKPWTFFWTYTSDLAHIREAVSIVAIAFPARW